MDDLITKILKSLVAVLLAGISIIVGAQVFFRFVLSNPLPWPEELGRLLFIYLSFIGAGVTSLYDDHISVEIMDEMMKGSKKLEVLKIFRHMLIVVVMIFILIGGFQVFPNAARIKLSATALPKSLMTLAVIIGAFFMCYGSIKQIFVSIRKIKV